MAIRFDSARRVKPRTNREFGRGLFAYAPSYRADHTARDYADYLAMIAEEDRREQEARRAAEREFDAACEERYATWLGRERVECGTVC